MSSPGGLAILTGKGSRHRAQATVPSRILEITAGSFQKLMGERPEVGEVFISTLARRMRESQAWLRQQEKMAALGKLSAGLAHELNNPAAPPAAPPRICVKRPSRPKEQPSPTTNALPPPREIC